MRTLKTKTLPILFTILCSFLLLSNTYAQKEVKGIVLDKNSSMPLPGANVMGVSETGELIHTVGTITDLDGRFVLKLNSSVKALQISFIGYKSNTVELNGKDFFHIELVEDTKTIEAVVVTGYSKIEKRKLTASVSKIKIDDKLPQAVMSVDQMLQGQLAGVSITPTSGTPGAPAKIRIRGTSSINGTQDPLWVLDGIPLEGTDIPDMEEAYDIDNLYSSAIAGLNPSDIADITVLKDAAATAIYGARAANGVIVITTKNGKKGDLKVNYSVKTSFVQKPDISRLNLLDSDQKVDLELALLQSDYDFNDDKGEVARILDRYNEKTIFSNNGWDALSPSARNSIDSLRGINTNWNDLLFRSAFSQDHSLSLSGGSDNATYYFSAGYYEEKGTTIGVNTKRYNVTAKTQFKFSDKLKFGVGMFANQRENASYLTNTKGYTNPVYYSRLANPYLKPLDENGDYIYDQDIQGWGKDGSLLYNIFEERENTSNEQTVRSLNTIFDLEYRLLPVLTYTSQLGLQYDFDKKESFAAEESYSNRLDMERSRLQEGSYLPTGGISENTNSTQFQYTFKNMLRFSKVFDATHELEVMAGNELRRTKYSSVFAAAYGYSEQSLTNKPVIWPDKSYARNFPLFRKAYVENAFVSFFATGSYTYNRKYTLGASIRYDGSDIFGADPKYRYVPLYSVSGLWRASEENFIKPVNWINNLAFRVSYGVQGNIDKSTSAKLVGEWQQEVEILPGASEDNIYVAAPPNDKLRWEKTKNYNFGLDLVVLNNRVNLTTDYYIRKSTDLIGLKALPLETGFTHTTINWSSMTNQGVEVNLNLTPVKKKDFSWTIGFNFAHNDNEVNKLTKRSDDQSPSIEGYPVGSVFALPYAGMDEQGYPLIYNSEGNAVSLSELLGLYTGLGGSTVRSITPKQERELYQYIGTDEAPYSGGITNSFKYKNWDLYASFAFNFGHKYLVRPYYSFTSYDRGLNTSDYILNRWTEENTSANLPRLITSSTEGRDNLDYEGYEELNFEDKLSLWVRDADYLRLQTIRLGYTFSKDILQKINLSSLRLAVEGRNLWVWGEDYNGFLDPETMKNPYAQPIPKSITFSLNVGF